MLSSRLNRDAKQSSPLMRPTAFRTGPNRYRLSCAWCGSIYYVDAATFSAVSLAALQGQGNSFYCQDCQEELTGTARNQ
jgi:hypothetical protein